jgi:hypothetical protein
MNDTTRTIMFALGAVVLMGGMMLLMMGGGWLFGGVALLMLALCVLMPALGIGWQRMRRSKRARDVE